MLMNDLKDNRIIFSIQILANFYTMFLSTKDIIEISTWIESFDVKGRLNTDTNRQQIVSTVLSFSSIFLLVKSLYLSIFQPIEKRQKTTEVVTICPLFLFPITLLAAIVSSPGTICRR